MDKTAMDALNKGWALGFGTRPRTQEQDITAALDRNERVETPPLKRVRADWLLLLAIGPMPRAAH